MVSVVMVLWSDGFFVNSPLCIQRKCVWLLSPEEVSACVVSVKGRYLWKAPEKSCLVRSIFPSRRYSPWWETLSCCCAAAAPRFSEPRDVLGSVPWGSGMWLWCMSLGSVSWLLWLSVTLGDQKSCSAWSFSRENVDITFEGLEEAANCFACFSVSGVCWVNVGWLLTPSSAKPFAQAAVADQA